MLLYGMAGRAVASRDEARGFEYRFLATEYQR